MPKSQTTTAPETKKYGVKKNPLTDLDLPSGGLVQVRRPGLQGLISAGVLDSLDTLQAIVQTETLPKAQGMPPADPSDAPKTYSKQQIEDSLDMLDKIVLAVVVQPTILPVPADGGRDLDADYIDELDIEDKTFIVQYAMGGTRDLERFRADTAGALAGVPAGT